MQDPKIRGHAMLENVTVTSQTLNYKARIELTAKPTDQAELLCVQLFLCHTALSEWYCE